MMTDAEVEFAKDILKALDIGVDGKARPDSEYESDLYSSTRFELKRTVRFLMQLGYKKTEATPCSPSTNT